MQQVVIHRHGNGRCLIRNVDCEGVEADFGGVLKGFFSKADFWKILKARSTDANDAVAQADSSLQTSSAT